MTGEAVVMSGGPVDGKESIVEPGLLRIEYRMLTSISRRDDRIIPCDDHRYLRTDRTENGMTVFEYEGLSKG